MDKDELRTKRHQELLEVAQKKGGDVIEGLYTTTTCRYSIKCSKGHEWRVMWRNIVINGSWCRLCRAKGHKPTIVTLEDCIEYAEAKGGECLSDMYVNSRTKIQWRCIEGHEWEVPFGGKRHKNWCRQCKMKEAGLKHRSTLAEVMEVAKQRGGICLSTEYLPGDGKMHWKCNACDKEWFATFHAVKYGTWCGICPRKKRDAKRRYTIDKVREIGVENGGKLLSDTYVNCEGKLEWECKERHVFIMSYNHVQRGSWCSICRCEKLPERTIRLYLERNNVEYIREWKMPNTRMRFDFFIPHLNLVIEFDGKGHFMQCYGEPTNYERSLKRILERDEAKDKYCEDNRLSMFRCCYIDMPTIEEAIEEALKYFAMVEYDHINPNRAYKAHLLSIQP
jgi:hypothetical protein